MSVAEPQQMAKKKTGPKPNSEEWKITPLAIQVRGSVEFKEWVRGLAEFDATDVSEVVERALGAYARQIGYDKARPRR